MCVCVCFSQFTLVFELSTCWSEILRMVSWELRVFRSVGLHNMQKVWVCQCVSVRTFVCVHVCSACKQLPGNQSFDSCPGEGWWCQEGGAMDLHGLATAYLINY